MLLLIFYPSGFNIATGKPVMFMLHNNSNILLTQGGTLCTRIMFIMCVPVQVSDQDIIMVYINTGSRVENRNLQKHQCCSYVIIPLMNISLIIKITIKSYS